MAHRKVITAALIAGALLAWTRSASAQSFLNNGSEPRLSFPVTFLAPAPAEASAQPPVVASISSPAEFRPAPKSSMLAGSLVGLYATTATLQMLDVRSTYAVLARGGAEGNPVMSRVVQNKPAFVAVKAALAAGTIIAARQMAKRSRLAAVVTLVALNSAYATVVAHNFSVARRLQ
jgi:hypothetical protein